MDIVDTFNHLIPSDQLDDSLIIGQNLECEASIEFGPGPQLEDSLKNMLSDKDPMFGSASSHFNLLDNEDSAFQIAGSTGLDDGSSSRGLTGELTATVKRPIGRPRKRPQNLESESTDGPQPPSSSTSARLRGRPRKKPFNWLQKSFLIEKGVSGTQLKQELTLGGRVNIHDLDGGLWLNPSVVLRRLTVTIGGFRIELLPGPSYTQNAIATQSECFDDGFSYSGDMGFSMLQDDSVGIQHPIPETAELDEMEKTCLDEGPLGLGPYVNPNDVQTANGTLMEIPYIVETKSDNRDVPGKQKTVNKEDHGTKRPPPNDGKTEAHKTDGKKNQQLGPKKLVTLKSGLSSDKDPGLISHKPSNAMKEPKESQDMRSANVQGGELHKVKSPKEKGFVSLKRHGDHAQRVHPNKVQRLEVTGDAKVKPKPLSPFGNRHGDQQGQSKHTPSHDMSKAETVHLTHGHSGHSLKTIEDDSHEKSKVKKPEKILQRQKSKNARSISVDEPELFIPDNAPAVKKEPVVEQPAASDAVWDGNNCCGLCKQHHNNMIMVGCGRCDDWFHGDCVGLDMTKIREMQEEDQMYVCLKCCDEESTKVEPETPRTTSESQGKNEVQDHKLPVKPKPVPSHTVASGGVRTGGKDSERRHSTDGREAAHKTGAQLKQDTKNKMPSSTAKKPVSSEEIRRSVRDSLKEILIQRVRVSKLDVSLERATEVAKKTERELFHLYKDTDNKYKNKYRSLMFNLKDTKNNVLFKRVLKGEISPATLIRMSPEELASKELAAWRQRENRHTIEMIEKEQREVERRPITKLTHKGEIEIESQEPVKVPAELQPPPKVIKVMTDPEKAPAKKPESTKDEKDTTSQHKSHLFDLHCKICTGHMVPPVEEAQTKAVKVATTVIRRQSTKVEETKSTPPPVTDDDLHLTVLEESFRSAQSGNYEGRLDHTTAKGEEITFLSTLKSLWRGFIHMHSVAKLVTKAFPVSGIFDQLTEDLPDSIQVGGRITPQIVWDYLEKIRATGTKEVCLIRFSPETEEDEISYTLLYAYFSSRKRFGVVSNNLKQVKDMYLIPLGSTEKVPHQLVPFDGPGLENNRANLLLGLIIRQRPKRDFHPVDVNETARIIPEIKPITTATKETRVTEEDEKFYFSSLTPSHVKEADKPLSTTADVNEPTTETSEEPSASEETTNQETQKPLRFLPGVLVGWGGELPPLPDFGGKPAPEADDTEMTQSFLKTDAPTGGNAKSPTAAVPRDRFVIKKKESKPAKAEAEVSGKAGPEVSGKAGPEVSGKAGPEVSGKAGPEVSGKAGPEVSGKAGPEVSGKAGPEVSGKAGPEVSGKAGPEVSGKAGPEVSGKAGPEVSGKAGPEVSGPNATEAAAHSVSISLKDKPPDVSTEAYLASLSTAASGNESGGTVSTTEGDADFLTELEKEKPEDDSLLQSNSEVSASDHTNASKPPEMVKKVSSYSSENEADSPVLLEGEITSSPPQSPKPVPVLSSTRSDSVSLFHQQSSHLSQTELESEDQEQANMSSFCNESQDPDIYQPGATITATVYPPVVHEPQDECYATTYIEASEVRQDPVTSPVYNSGARLQPQQPQVYGSYDYLHANTMSSSQAPDHSHGTLWAHDGASYLRHLPQSYSESPGRLQSVAKDHRRLEERYCDPWERPRNMEDRDHHGRHSHRRDSHGRKSRHHERERKHDRSHDDKHRESSRRHGHSEDRHGERRKERHHSDDYSSRHKDRHRHRRDSDYENGRRSSKDSFS
ncbi:PHD finger protein 3 [Thalassophryne amazonica]|uniref:PHD finger protein 3 n=1 Tax=Thalassophryne amazonica TaxID=390379 RepID=UPI001472459C|nr:PHD finger protein 3 [Thalassophryne amazonica]